MPSLYSCIYSSDGKEAHNKRAQQRAVRTTGINKLGEDEYRKLLQEIDLMTHTPANIEELINKRMKEIEKRVAAEQQEKEATERRQTRSQVDKPGTSTATDTGTEPVQRGSQRKQKADDTDDTSRSRSQTGVKRPKQKSTTEPNRELVARSLKQTTPMTHRGVELTLEVNDQNRKRQVRYQC